MSKPTAIAACSVSYTFGHNQAEGINNVSVPVTVQSVDPFDGTTKNVTQAVCVQLPATGWTDADVLAAVAAKMPDYDVMWTPVPEPVVVEETPVL